ncbi:MAG: rhomboid family intramembrane serine protease [Xanthobacteraceae bacterium]|nr:rhomboid family intramembrane serine protease [Xanthobacteraceae bacterium]
MVIPIYDDNPLVFKTRPYVTWLLIFANVAIFIFLQTEALSDAQQSFARALTFKPSHVGHGTTMTTGQTWIPWELTLVTYMFLHANWFHLIGNMLFLWVFGDDVEDTFGRIRYLAFYILCGVAGGLAHYFSAPNSQLPLIGASGAIAGIVAAYLMVRPCTKVWVLVLMSFPIRLPAYLVLGSWVLLQIWHVMFPSDGHTSWWTHIGGLAAGAMLVIVMRKPGVKLFECYQTAAERKLPPTKPGVVRVDTP